MTLALEALRAYFALGWCAIPVRHPSHDAPEAGGRGKRPGLGSAAAWRRLWDREDLWFPGRPAESTGDGCGWEYLRLHADALDVLGDGSINVGVNLGEPSGGLADVDLDCPEASELAPRFLPATWTWGRTRAPASHRAYLAPGATSETLRDLPDAGTGNGKVICELRATPPSAVGTGIGGHQTVLPASFHKSGEPVEWDADSHDATEAPLEIDAAELAAAVRSLAAAVLVMRHAGREPALAWLDGAAPCPALLGPVEARAREWWGLPQRPTRPKRAPWAPATPGADWTAAVRERGPLAVADAFGLESDERNGLRTCPACGSDTRGSTDRRHAAGWIKSKSGEQLWTHGKCGATGDALKLAALVVTGRSKGLGRAGWAKVRAECVTRGILTEVQP